VVAQPHVVGRYAIYDKIASGGMASVHFGRLIGSAGFTRTVAIKRLHPHLMEDPQFLKTLIDEARLASRIHHPNVVPTLDVVATDTELLVVMEYVRGESLARLLRSRAAAGERIPLPIASAIGVGALLGLHAAHEATSDQGTPLGIVHRDVSPQNILVGSDGSARIIDFGVAKAAGRLQSTGDGVLKGKIAYMAPEQLESQPVTSRADVYSMAVVLWEVVAGRRLFEGESQGAVMTNVLRAITVPPSRYAVGLPAGLDELIMTGLQPDPERRFATAREMADGLARLVPPALAPDVGAWVRQVAGDSLAVRGAALAEIESSSGLVPVLPAARADAPTSAIHAAEPSVDVVVENSEVVGVSQVSSLAVAASMETGLRSTRSARRRFAAILCAAFVVLAAAAFVILRSPDREPTRASDPVVVQAPSGSSGVAVGLASSAPVPASPPSASAFAPAAAASQSAAATPTPTAPSREPGRRQPAAVGQGPAAPASSRTTGTGAAANCNPNFTYNAQGDKIFKPECFAR
jgi:serine/threonine-protein kinase